MVLAHFPGNGGSSHFGEGKYIIRSVRPPVGNSDEVYTRLGRISTGAVDTSRRQHAVGSGQNARAPQ